MLASVWDHFEIIVGQCWDHFGIIVGPFWNQFGNMLGSFWDSCGIMLGLFLGICLGWMFDVRMFDVRCYVRTGRCYVMLVFDL